MPDTKGLVIRTRYVCRSGVAGIWLTHLGQIPAPLPRPHIVEICPSASRSPCCARSPQLPRESTTTVAEIINIVRNSIAKHDSDGALAKNLHKLKTVEKLDDHTVEELESAGAGPKSVAELERLRDASAALPPPADPPPFRYGPRPSIEEQRRDHQRRAADRRQLRQIAPRFHVRRSGPPLR